MQQGSIELTRNNLLDFLDFAGEKGLIKKATADARKAACSAVLGILDNAEAMNISKVNLDNLILRYRNLAAGKIVPRTLSTYETRVRIAVKDFIEYSKDPSSWKPAGRQRVGRASKVKKTKSGSATSETQEVEKPGEIPSQPAVHIDFQIHISPEATPEQIDQIFASMRRHLYG